MPDHLQSRIRRPTMLLACALLLCCIVPSGGAEEERPGSIYGEVRDPASEPLPGVLITVQNDAGDRSKVTDERGRYKIIALAAGTYVLTAELEGFESIEIPDVSVHAGKTTEQNLTMSIPPPESVSNEATDDPEG